MEGVFPSVGMLDPLEKVLTNEDLDWELHPKVEEILAFLHPEHGPRLSSFLELEWGNNPKPKPSVEEPPELEFSSFLPASSIFFLTLNLLFHLWFLQVAMKLLSVLKDNKEVFGWITHDIKGLDPTLSTHKINIEEGFPPKWLFQKRLNPNIMEVVKREDVKPTFKTNAHKVKVYYEGFQQLQNIVHLWILWLT